MPAPEQPPTAPPALETRRLALRALSAQDLPSVHPIFDDPAVRRHLFDDASVSLETARSLLGGSEKDFARGGVGLFGIRRRGSAALIGFCGFFVVEGVGEPELTYGLLSAWWGRGLATEAARAVTRYALERAGFRRVLVAADEANVPSMRVIQRLGARPLGTISPALPGVAYFEIGRRTEERRQCQDRKERR